jgi:phage gpG-like protein
MDLKDLENYLDEIARDIDQAVSHDIPEIIGREAVNFFQEGFQNEGFTDSALSPWKEVKRRQGKGYGSDAMRKILTGRTGALHDSITFDIEPGRVVIYANPMNSGAESNYAAVHNFGTTSAGRNRNVVIPARPFLLHSEKLNDRIVEKIEKLLNDKIK